MRKLYSKEVISKDVCKRVRDKESRDTSEERLERIVDDIEDRIKHDAIVLMIFLDVLNNLSRKDLADIIMAKYKGIYYKLFVTLFDIICIFVIVRTREGDSTKLNQLGTLPLQQQSDVVLLS